MAGHVATPEPRLDGLQIRPDPLRSDAVIALLRAHHQALRQTSPPGSCHVLDLDGLRQPGIAFWCAWLDDRLAGCAALKQLDARHGELKSMRTADACLRRGVAKALLRHVITEATHRGYARLSLETGAMDYFTPARRLYAASGFVPCGPFGEYVEDPHSLYMTRMLR